MVESPVPDRGPGIVALCTIMMVLSILAVTFRIWCRLIYRNQKFWWDDWTAIASLPTVLAILSLTIAEVSAGLGRHIHQLSPVNVALLYKYRYAIGFIYHFGITLPKYSAILFYIRLFYRNSSPSFRVNIRIAASLVTAWLLAAVLSTIFDCTPVRKGWLPETPGHCLDTDRWFLGTTITSVVIDFYIMIIPVPVLWSLHTSQTRKVVLTGFFFCANCVMACSIGRLISIVQDSHTFSADQTWNTITYTRWSLAEVAISTVCICLPSMAQLAQRARQQGVGALFTTTNNNHNNKNNNVGAGAFQRIDGDGSSGGGAGEEEEEEEPHSSSASRTRGRAGESVSVLESEAGHVIKMDRMRNVWAGHSN